MSDLNYEEIASILQETIPSHFQELLASVNLVNEEVEYSKVAVDKVLQNAINRNDYDTVRKLVSVSESLHNISGDIGNFLRRYKINIPNPVESASLSEEKNIISANKVDYDIYRVDETIAYDLFSPVTFRRPAAFSFKGRKYNISTWGGMLVSVCGLLYDLDCKKFKSLLNDKRFQGKKHSKITDQKERTRKGIEIKNSGIYVEINLSANDIREFIIALLNAYGLSNDTLKFYLSKDLSALHNDTE